MNYVRSIMAGCVAALLILFSGQAMGQGYMNKHPFDLKRFNLGLLMGFTYNSYNLKEQIDIYDPADGRTLESITLISKPGVNIGMISNLNLAKQVSLRFIPTISLEQRDFTYRFRDQEGTELRKIEASYINLPLMFQFKTGYYDSTRVYVLAGGQWGYNLASNDRVRDDPTLLKIQRQDLSVVLGFGFNLYGERLKLSPEIVYKAGLFNIYVPEDTTHAEAINRLFSQVISLNVNFE